MPIGEIILLIIFIVVGIFVILYFVSKKYLKKSLDAQGMIEQNKMITSIFIIEKFHEKPTEKLLTKAVFSQMPKIAKMRKMYLVRAKVGARVAVLFCDKNVYEAIATKKTIKVEMAGLYIVKVIGMNLENKKNKSIRQKMALYANNATKNLNKSDDN